MCLCGCLQPAIVVTSRIEKLKIQMNVMSCVRRIDCCHSMLKRPKNHNSTCNTYFHRPYPIHFAVRINIFQCIYLCCCLKKSTCDSFEFFMLLNRWLQKSNPLFFEKKKQHAHTHAHRWLFTFGVYNYVVMRVRTRKPPNHTIHLN